MRAPNSPCFHETRASTWSWKYAVPNCTSGYHLVAYELGAHDLAGGMGMLEGRLEDDAVALDRGDALDLERVALVHPHAHQRAAPEPRGAAELDLSASLLRIGLQDLPRFGKWAHRLLVCEAGADAVARLDVELDQVHVDTHLAEEGVLGSVRELALEYEVHAVLPRVGAQREGDSKVVARAHGLLVLLQDV